MNEELLALLCHMAIDAPEDAVGEIMFMPAGQHTITPSQGGRPVTVHVVVDPESAQALEAQRAAMEAKGKKPYFDFNHEDREASFWPEAFFWKDGPKPGVYARGRWSEKGRRSVMGREWRQFSPVFFVDNVRAKPARIVARADASPNMGGLVNDPAFSEILPFWAKDAGAPSGTNNQTKGNQVNEQELAELQAKNQKLEQEIADLRKQQEAIKAKNENDAIVAAEIKAKEAELEAGRAKAEAEEVKAKNKQLEDAARQRAEKDADDAIAAAVARGAIAAKDEETKKGWKEMIVADPSKAALLAKVPGNPAISGNRVTDPHIEVQGEGLEAVCNGLSALVSRNREATNMTEKAELGRQIGAIFAKEFRQDSRLLDAPLSAANSLGTVAGTLVTLRTLELLKLTFPILDRIATDFSGESAAYGQTVMSRIVGIPSVQTYTTSVGWADSSHVTTDVPVVINQHKGVPITFNANELASTLRRLFDESAPAAAYALAKNMVDALYALITATNYTESPTSSSLPAFNRAKVIAMGTALNIRGVPQGAMNRTLLLHSNYFGRLAEDNAIVSLAAFQRPEYITQRALPVVHDFNVIEAPNLPAGIDDVVGFGFSKSALVLATRLPNDYTTALPGAAHGNVTTVTLPDTGISAMQVQYVDHTLGRATQRLSLMYGVAKGQVKAGQLLVEASSSSSSASST